MTEAETVIGVGQVRAIAAPLSHWLVSQWAPPPSKQPLAINCQQATVSAPAQPLVVIPCSNN